MKILILSYFFPPLNQVGVLRANYFVSYLAKKDFKVTVLKGDELNFSDNELEKNSPQYNSNVKVISLRVKAWKIPGINAIDGLRVYYSFLRTHLVENKYDVVFITGSPFFYFPLTKMFKKCYALPVILDLRDPCFYPKKLFNNKIFSNISDKIKFYLLNIANYFNEKISFKYADKIINVTDELTNYYIESYPKYKGKFLTIMNGYDDLRLPKRSELMELDDKVLKLGIMGKFAFYNDKQPEILAKVIELLQDSGIACELHTIGRTEDKFKEVFKKYNLEDSLINHGNLPYKDGLIRLSQCHVLITNNYMPYAIGTKIFDYIFLGRPIIAFIDNDSAIAKLLVEFKHACIAGSENVVFEFLNDIWSEKKFCLSDEDKIDNFKFSRACQSEKLRKLLLTFK